MAEEKKETNNPQPDELDDAYFLRAYDDYMSRMKDRMPRMNSAQRTWKNLVGLHWREAEKRIKEDVPWALVEVVPSSAFVVTQEYCCDRVRLYVDLYGRVASVPQAG